MSILDRFGQPYSGQLCAPFAVPMGFMKNKASAGRLTIGVSKLTSGFSDTDQLTMTTASVSPGSNSLLLLGIAITQPTVTDPTTVVGNGLTWVKVTHIDMGTTGPERRLLLYRSMGASPSSGTIVATWSANITGVVWALIECSNVDTSGTNGSGAVVQSATVASASSVTTQTNTLSAFEHANNVHVAFTHLRATTGVTPDADFAELSNDASTAPANNLESEWAVNQTPCTVTHASSADAMLSAEVKAG